MVTRLDRLARSTHDLLNTLDTIAKDGAGFRSLATYGRTRQKFTMNHVYVAGSINMDVVAIAARYPKMGETVQILFFLGGKGANQAVSAAKLGAPAILIGCLGEDAFGQELSTFLSSQGIDLTNVRYSTESHTGTAVITVVGQTTRSAPTGTDVAARP
jgi:fructose-1-phosphate kinase PfkB-like protein